MRLGSKGKPTLLFLYAHLLHPERLKEAGITGATGSCIPAKVRGYCTKLADNGCRASLVAGNGCPSEEAIGIICSASPDATQHLREGIGLIKVEAKPIMQGLQPIEASALQYEESSDCADPIRSLGEALCFWEASMKGFKDMYLKGVTQVKLNINC